jgi:putative Mg2+ transporter-C (MgtC) family protein
MDTVDQLSSLDILVRLGLAATIGSVLGMDRELRGKPAGLRTHALVALGSALFALIGLHLEHLGGTGEQAFSRVIQGVVTGIGFLGGGAILKDQGTGNVYGLTTAASIWIVAGLGLACGAGYWRVGLIALLLTLIVLIFGGPLEQLINRLFKQTSGDLPPQDSSIN